MDSSTPATAGTTAAATLPASNMGVMPLTVKKQM